MGLQKLPVREKFELSGSLFQPDLVEEDTSCKKDMVPLRRSLSREVVMEVVDSSEDDLEVPKAAMQPKSNYQSLRKKLQLDENEEMKYATSPEIPVSNNF